MGQRHSSFPSDPEREHIARDHADQVSIIANGGEDAGSIQSPSPPAIIPKVPSIPCAPSRVREPNSREDWGSDLQQKSPIDANREASRSLVDFQSLVDRSISVWRTINYVGAERNSEVEKKATIDHEIERLQRCTCLDDVLKSKGYWFFQLRQSFLRQKSTFMKWNPARLDEYVLLPVNYGFVNNRDCFFVSHYWHTKEHPDPEGVDLLQVQQDLEDLEWSYVWVDWTCVPQLPRTEIEQKYFDRSLHFIHMLVRDCGFEWRFPAFEPRGWILYEVAEYVLNHKNFAWTDDNRPFIEHLSQMSAEGVRPVMERYGYRCSNQGDLNLVIGWLELAILLAQLLPNDIGARQQIWDDLDRPYVGTLVDASSGLEVDKVSGTVKHKGQTYTFTPTWNIDN